jgi:hypothetical protein
LQEVRLELAWTIRLDVSISSIGTNNLPRHLHRPESLANEFAWQHSKEHAGWATPPKIST